MSAGLTPEGRRAVDDIAHRTGLSSDVVVAMLTAVRIGGGRMAQFNLPELGGSGQWMRGGMTMVGNMFDNDLKARVDTLCTELADLLDTTDVFTQSTPQQGSSGQWWPEQLGVPSSSGGQNDTRYAIFPAAHRLALWLNGVVRVFDTGDHRVTGVQQQQGGAPGTISFTSQLGTFDVAGLRDVGRTEVPTEQAHPSSPEAPATPAAPVTPLMDSPGRATGSDDVIAAIEKLADLHSRGILTDAEFAAKKADLLERL